MNKALVDTDLLSEVLKGVDPTVQRNATAYRRAMGRFTISALTVMEVVKGHHRVRREPRLQGFLQRCQNEEILDFDRDSAEMAGRILADLERAGTPIGPFDPLIAATALRHGLDLVTGNTRHYQRIQQLGYPLILVDWRN